MLQLADGSRWQIQPAGQGVTLQWSPQDPVEVISVGHPSFSFVLANRRTGQGARARRLGR
jgi:hypothetical protein